MSVPFKQDVDILGYLKVNGLNVVVQDSSGNVLATILIRQDTEANLASVVPYLGQPALATDSEKFTVGDGSTTFPNLPGIAFTLIAGVSVIKGLANSAQFGSDAVALGLGAFASGYNQNADVGSMVAYGRGSHIEGDATTGQKLRAYEGCAHAEGRNTKAIGFAAHAGGTSSVAGGGNSYADGSSNLAYGQNSHAEGSGCQTGYGPDTFTLSVGTLTLAGVDLRLKYPSGSGVVLYDLTGGTSTLMVASGAANFTSYSGGNTIFGPPSAIVSTDRTGGQIFPTGPGTSSYAGGTNALAVKRSAWAWATGMFSAVGDAQRSGIILRAATTNATPTELTIFASAVTGTDEGYASRFIVALNKTYDCMIYITARKDDGTSAGWVRRAMIKNVSGTVTIDLQTMGTDINPSSWGLAVQADNTNKSLQIIGTGVASNNIRWMATVEANELTY